MSSRRILSKTFAELGGLTYEEALDKEWPEPDWLPLLGCEGWFVRGWTHLLAAYPRVGKTELLWRCAREWGQRGYKVGYFTEEDWGTWSQRLRVPTELPRKTTISILPSVGIDSQELLANTADFDIVIVDTIRLLGIKDENNSALVHERIIPWVDVSRKAGRTLICSHHTNKKGGDDGRAIAGAHVFLASFDIGMEMSPSGSQEDEEAPRFIQTYPRVTQKRLAYVRMMPDGEFKLQDNNATSQNDVLEWLQRAEGPLSPRDLSRILGKSSKAVEAALSKLLAKGSIKRTSHGLYTVSP